MARLTTQIAKIDFEIEQLNFKKDALLRKWGWESTSSTKGSLWLWKKVIEGQTYIVSREAAIHAQAWLDEFGPRESVKENSK